MFQDLALGVAVGSSIQIALFAIPITVIVAWVQGIPFSLDFDSLRYKTSCKTACYNLRYSRML